MVVKKIILAVVFSIGQHFCFGQYNGSYYTSLDTIPCLNGVSGISILSKREILHTLDCITVNISGVKVVSFSIAYSTEGGVIGYSSNSNLLTDKMKSTFGKDYVTGAQFCEYVLSNSVGENKTGKVK